MIKILKKLNIKHIILILISTLLIVGQVWLDLKIPDYMRDLTVIIKTPNSVLKDLFKPSSLMILCALGSLSLAIITSLLLSFAATNFSKNLRRDVFYKIEDYNLEEIKKFSTSSLIIRSTNDIMNIQRFLSMGIQVIIKAPILAIWAISKIYTRNLTWSLLTGGFVVFMLIAVSIIIALTLPKTSIIQKLIDNLNRISREHITGIRVIKAFNAKKFHEDKFEVANEDVTKTNLYIAKKMALLSPLIMLVMSLLTLSIYYTGANLIDSASMLDKIDLFSNMVVFSAYATQVIMAFMMLVMIFMILPRARVSAIRIKEILEEDVKVKSGKYNKKSNTKGMIEFKNVSFKYPDAEECILRDITFSARPGEVIAFIGSTGSGKSTLINLIPRLYDVTKGEILINGVNVKKYDLKHLNSFVSYVPQQAAIFEGSIKYNVGYGNKRINNNRVIEALKIAQAYNFVKKLPKGINNKVSSRGTNLSGGQKQRISIARAIYKNPDIYIFDDSFSALDYKTDAKLRSELKKHMSDATVLIVAQRIGTIMHADKIVVLHEGRVEKMGTHKELLKSSKIYREIAEAQLPKEDLK